MYSAIEWHITRKRLIFAITLVHIRLVWLGLYFPSIVTFLCYSVPTVQCCLCFGVDYSGLSTVYARGSRYLFISITHVQAMKLCIKCKTTCQNFNENRYWDMLNNVTQQDKTSIKEMFPQVNIPVYTPILIIQTAAVCIAGN
jgi:hypothetical protein